MILDILHIGPITVSADMFDFEPFSLNNEQYSFLSKGQGKVLNQIVTDTFLWGNMNRQLAFFSAIGVLNGSSPLLESGLSTGNSIFTLVKCIEANSPGFFMNYHEWLQSGVALSTSGTGLDDSQTQTQMSESIAKIFISKYDGTLKLNLEDLRSCESIKSSLKGEFAFSGLNAAPNVSLHKYKIRKRFLVYLVSLIAEASGMSCIRIYNVFFSFED